MTAPEEGSRLLAIETSGDQCSVALMLDGACAVEQLFVHRMHLSERLIDTVKTVLAAAEMKLQDVTGMAVDIGPGSFTGTRIGVMTAKTLCAVRGLPLYGVSGLEALGWVYRGLRGTLVTPILPCRTDVVFAGAYEVSGEAPVTRLEPEALAVDALAAWIGESGAARVLICGAATPRYGLRLKEALEECGTDASLGGELCPRASSIGRLALARIADGLAGESPLDLVPLYVSPPPITAPRIPIPQG